MEINWATITSMVMIMIEHQPNGVTVGLLINLATHHQQNKVMVWSTVQPYSTARSMLYTQTLIHNYQRWGNGHVTFEAQSSHDILYDGCTHITWNCTIPNCTHTHTHTHKHVHTLIVNIQKWGNGHKTFEPQNVHALTNVHAQVQRDTSWLVNPAHTYITHHTCEDIIINT